MTQTERLACPVKIPLRSTGAFLIALGLALGILVTGAGCQTLLGVDDVITCGPGAEWWNCNYNRRLITLDNSDGGQELTDFPVLIRLALDDREGINADGSDLVFVADDQQTILSHEIERFRNGSEAQVWVRMPSIPANGTTRIFMYYGFTDEDLGENSTDVWIDGFEVVLHFHDFFDNLEVVKDSTSNERNATVVENPQRTPQTIIGQGVTFTDNPAGYLTLPALQELEPTPGDSKTLELWFKTDQPQAGALFHKENSCRGWSLSLDGNNRPHGRIARSGADCPAEYQPSEVSLGAAQAGIWYHVAVVAQNDPEEFTRVDVSARWIDADGQFQNNFVNSERNDIVDNTLVNDIAYIGVDFQQARPFIGTIDEFRISSGARSADWLEAQHANVAGDFVTLGDVERRPMGD